MVQSDRFYDGLNRLDEAFESGTIVYSSKGAGEVSIDEEYGVDEGDWLIWAFRVEPKTLNQFSVDSDIYSRWITVPCIFEPLLVYDFDDLTMKSPGGCAFGPRCSLAEGFCLGQIPELKEGPSFAGTQISGYEGHFTACWKC